MSYLVLARRWRPGKFSELVGQPHVTRTLLNSLKKDRIAHAYLFSGPRGVGKTTTARLLSKALNCRDRKDFEPCGKCENCVAIAESRFIDVIEIDAASNRGIDEIRQLREGVRYAPIEGMAKTYIIDEVHMLTEQAFNALLKTLEEPPAHAYFCLATTDPQKVPATILSRCQRFDFRRVSVADIRDHLKHICKVDDIEHDMEALDLIARKADGSVRDSLSLLDQVIAFTESRVLKDDTVEVVGDIRLDLFFRAVELVASASTKEAFQLDVDLALSGTDPQDYILGLEQHLIQILQIKSVGIENVDVPRDAVDEFKAAAKLIADADLIRLIQYCATAEVDIRRKFNPRTRLQLLLLRFASLEKSVVLADLIGRLEGQHHASRPAHRAGTAAAKPAGGPPKAKQPAPKRTEPAPAAAPVQRPASETVDNSDTEDVLLKAKQVWLKVCEKVVAAHNSNGRMIMLGGFPYSYNNKILKIRFSSRSHLDSAKACRRTLLKEFTAILGRIDIEFEVGDLPEQVKPQDEMEDDPVLKLLNDRLGARPVE